MKNKLAPHSIVGSNWNDCPRQPSRLNRFLRHAFACTALIVGVVITGGCEDPGEPDYSELTQPKSGSSGEAGGGSSRAIPEFSPIPEKDRVK